MPMPMTTYQQILIILDNFIGALFPPGTAVLLVRETWCSQAILQKNVFNSLTD